MTSVACLIFWLLGLLPCVPPFIGFPALGMSPGLARVLSSGSCLPIWPFLFFGQCDIYSQKHLPIRVFHHCRDYSKFRSSVSELHVQHIGIHRGSARLSCICALSLWRSVSMESWLLLAKILHRCSLVQHATRRAAESPETKRGQNPLMNREHLGHWIGTLSAFSVDWLKISVEIEKWDLDSYGVLLIEQQNIFRGWEIVSLQLGS